VSWPQNDNIEFGQRIIRLSSSNKVGVGNSDVGCLKPTRL